jgi:hypothetical protein
MNTAISQPNITCSLLEYFLIHKESYHLGLSFYFLLRVSLQQQNSIVKEKVKQSRYTPWRRLGERRYSSYSFSTSAIDVGEWSASRPGHALPPGKGPPIPIVQEAGWAPEPVWAQRLEEKSSAPAGDRTPNARSSSP